MTLQDMPKIELHSHLEGCAPPDLIRALAREKQIDIGGIFGPDGSYAFADFDAFLKVYEAACTTLQTPQDFHRLILAVCRAAAEQGVIYLESFVSPDFCGGGDVAIWKDYLAAMEEAADQAQRDHDITLKGIVTGIRHFGPEACNRAALCAAETKGDFIVGYGMAGAEMVGRPRDYTYSFDLAREAGLALTCHAGEWGGPAMVAETLRDLRVARIGHGIGAVQDAGLMRQIAGQGVVLEVCPGSNVALGAVPDWASHPIARLRDAGIAVTVSTDDPPFFKTDMTREFVMLERTFGWGADDVADLNRTALDAAFCDDATKDRLRKRLEQTA